jgi:hypothetical protein
MNVTLDLPDEGREPLDRSAAGGAEQVRRRRTDRSLEPGAPRTRFASWKNPLLSVASLITKQAEP